MSIQAGRTLLDKGVGAGRSRAWPIVKIRLRYPGPEGELELEHAPGASMTVGRDSDCELRLALPGVSRQHVRFTAEHDGLLIEDLGSTNGTLVDDQRIERATVQRAARIRLGSNGPWLEALFEQEPERDHDGATAAGGSVAVPPAAITAAPEPASWPSSTSRARVSSYPRLNLEVRRMTTRSALFADSAPSPRKRPVIKPEAEDASDLTFYMDAAITPPVGVPVAAAQAPPAAEPAAVDDDRTEPSGPPVSLSPARSRALGLVAAAIGLILGLALAMLLIR
jgi:hypothetical protein